MKRKKANFIFLVAFCLFLPSCLGIGQNLIVEESFMAIPYEEAFHLALRSAEQMHDECRRINPINYPVIVSLGTSKSRGVITVLYKYDPEAGSIGTDPPKSLSSMATSIFVPRFGAEFYMHIRFSREGDVARGVKIEVTQHKGIKKQIFQEEMEKLKKTYLTYLKRNWK